MRECCKKFDIIDEQILAKSWSMSVEKDSGYQTRRRQETLVAPSSLQPTSHKTCVPQLFAKELDMQTFFIEVVQLGLFCAKPCSFVGIELFALHMK